MRRLFFLVFFVLSLINGKAQSVERPTYGPNDTVLVSAIYYDHQWMPYSEMEMVYVSNVPYAKMVKILQEYNRLRTAVYVTYPYARTAGAIINDVNARLKGVSSKNERKKYIKSREGELKKEFSDPLSNLSVYQGKVLMKLINRQSGNDCYEIIKEYRGGLNARMYQTVAFFFGSSLKQEFDAVHNSTDRQIENIVREIDGVWCNNPYRPGMMPAKSQ